MQIDKRTCASREKSFGVRGTALRRKRPRASQLRRSTALRQHVGDKSQEPVDARFMTTMAETVRGAQARLGGTIGDARAAHDSRPGSSRRRHGPHATRELADAESF